MYEQTASLSDFFPLLSGVVNLQPSERRADRSLQRRACHNPTGVQLPGQYSARGNPRVLVVATGNELSTLHAPLIRDGRMDKFYRAPTRNVDRVGVCAGIFHADGLHRRTAGVDAFPGQSIGHGCTTTR
ncbi:hypothetical protein ACP70R_017464 [Stipagrostis hirtigluma subsp. patula]